MSDDLSLVNTLQATLPVDVFSMARALGIKVMTADIDANGSVIRVGKSLVVTLNADDSEQRQRFTLAHMIAHYLLHRDLLKTGVHIDRLFGGNSNPSKPLEPNHDVQANRMAIEILMPVAQMRRHQDKDLETLARMMNVSKAALELRQKSLKLDA